MKLPSLSRMFPTKLVSSQKQDSDGFDGLGASWEGHQTARNSLDTAHVQNGNRTDQDEGVPTYPPLNSYSPTERLVSNTEVWRTGEEHNHTNDKTKIEAVELENSNNHYPTHEENTCGYDRPADDVDMKNDHRDLRYVILGNKFSALY